MVDHDTSRSPTVPMISGVAVASALLSAAIIGLTRFSSPNADSDIDAASHDSPAIWNLVLSNHGERLYCRNIAGKVESIEWHGNRFGRHRSELPFEACSHLFAAPRGELIALRLQNETRMHFPDRPGNDYSIPDPRASIYKVAGSPDGRLIAESHCDGRIVVRIAASGARYQSLPPSPQRADAKLAFLTSDCLLIAKDDLELWHVPSDGGGDLRLLGKYDVGFRIHALHVSYAESLVVISGTAGQLICWDAASRRIVWEAEPIVTFATSAVAVSHDGTLLAIARNHRTLELFTLRTGEAIAQSETQGHANTVMVTSLVFSQDDDLLFVSFTNGAIHALSVPTLKPVRVDKQRPKSSLGSTRSIYGN